MVCRYRVSLLILFLMVMMLTGCVSNSTEKQSETKNTERKPQIGLSIDSFVIERWSRERDLFVTKAQELGAEVNVQNANGEVDEQIRQLEYFIDKGVDVIVVISIDDLALGDVLKKAQKAGIKIIAYDRLIRNANIDLFISMDNEKVGELMAKAIVKQIGDEGTIIQIKGSPTDYNVQMVQNGFEKVIDETNIVIDRAEYSENWVAENGFSVTDEYLAEGNVPDAIMCGNDNIAAQAIKALMEYRLGGKVCVVGQDADLEACQRIVEGMQYMTVYKPIENLAKEAAVISVEMAKGNMPKLTETINNGVYDIPYKKLTPIAVYRENMDEVITGKYHQKNEIYLNLQ